MHIGASRREDEFELNVISLIDVLLTLLMFFVLTTTFVQQSRMQVSLPQASDEARVPNPKALVLVIDRAGHFYLGNNEVLEPGIDGLKHALTRFAGSDRNRPVLLRADGQTPHQAVVTAMDVLGQLGFSHLRIATTPAKDQSQ